MDRKHLLELVDRLKKSGIKASVSKPRSETRLILQRSTATTN